MFSFVINWNVVICRVAWSSDYAISEQFYPRKSDHDSGKFQGKSRNFFFYILAITRFRDNFLHVKHYKQFLRLLSKNYTGTYHFAKGLFNIIMAKMATYRVFYIQGVLSTYRVFYIQGVLSTYRVFYIQGVLHTGCCCTLL